LYTLLAGHNLHRQDSRLSVWFRFMSMPSSDGLKNANMIMVFKHILHDFVLNQWSQMKLLSDLVLGVTFFAHHTFPDSSCCDRS